MYVQENFILLNQTIPWLCVYDLLCKPAMTLTSSPLLSSSSLALLLLLLPLLHLFSSSPLLLVPLLYPSSYLSSTSSTPLPPSPSPLPLFLLLPLLYPSSSASLPLLPPSTPLPPPPTSVSTSSTPPQRVFQLRKLISDFSIIISILVFCGLDYFMELDTPKLHVPTQIKVPHVPHNSLDPPLSPPHPLSFSLLPSLTISPPSWF